ncbi:MAG: pyridoxamine 5'-phosphate oxidase family protein [Desulfuromonadaceae bacterium]|nr:pyridoxamine 5'-phosphate oxidase family protein [Desulfuromonadaceae bacterium]
MTGKALQEFINQPQRVGTLATASADGQPNCALIGSAVLEDNDRLLLGLGNNRTLRNLKNNPHAIYSVFEPGASLLAWQGARLYLELETLDEQGPLLQQMIDQVTRQAGALAGGMIVAAVRFKVTAVRPQLDSCAN